MKTSFATGVCLSAFILFLQGCSSSAPVEISVTPRSAVVFSTQSLQLTATDSRGPSDVVWSASTTGTSGAMTPVDANGNFTAPQVTQNTTVTVTATSMHDPTKTAAATITVIAPGQVTATNNPQVALYSLNAPAGTTAFIQFSSDTSYGLKTWTQPAPTSGGPLSFFVAGMLANTQYHMRAVVQTADGATANDVDQTFTTTSFSAAQLPVISATTTPGLTPQSGVELLDLVAGTSTLASLAVADLSGNVLWAYTGIIPGPPNPIKLLPNGHFLINFSNAATDGANSALREVDLSGTQIWQMTAADLNAALAAATCAGCNITVLGTHHDFVLLPNGHLIVIAAQQQVKTIAGNPVTVTGDVIIDLDENHKPVWLWNEFDHLDVNRQPMGFPDWTHTNAVIYSADDGNLIISMRHQNWLVKIDYANGAGAGDIIWKLGYQGDFTLVGGTDPIDWFYAQHGPSFVSTNTTANFSLTVFDNGTDRIFGGVTCGSTGAPPCLYSTVPVLQIDETAKTATLTLHPTAPTYSFFGGNAGVLKNGNLEYCESAGGPGLAGDIYEVTQDSSAQTVWRMRVTGQYAYRGQRIPSFYPGVQW